MMLRIACVLAFFVSGVALADPPMGYYRQPAIHGDTVVFVAEGDLWKVTTKGGVATRLTTHPADEGTPSISPDGTQVAFSAEYEGPTEIYSMPIDGGLPRRLTWDGGRTVVCGWKGDQIIASTGRFSTLPSAQLVLINSKSGARELVPLAQAADGVYDDKGTTLFFTRLPFQGSHTKRYKGGTAQNLWRFADGDADATPLTADYAGASASPMWWKGRVYFNSDRDGTMEIWSMKTDGKDLKQHTHHDVLDIKSPALSDGRIVYQLGADLWIYDISKNSDKRIDIELSTDFDQTREHWIKKPMDYVTSAHIAPDGERVALTARGQVFVAPRSQGRFVEATRHNGVRYRDARFMPDGKSLLTLSDESGEVEFWTTPANGVGDAAQLTTDGEVLRWEGVPSPDGKWIAHHDKNQRLWLYNVEKKASAKIDESKNDGFEDLRWSPDSRWLAYVSTADNQNRQIKLRNVETDQTAFVTTDRYDSSDPAWSPDGKWLYLLSERHLRSVVGSPWGRLAPEPMFDKRDKIYQVALKQEYRSPFLPNDELHPQEKEADKKKKEQEKSKPSETQPSETQPADSQPGETKPADTAPDSQPASKPESGEEKPKEKAKPVEIELDGIATRLLEVPIPPGNYNNLTVTDKRLLWMSIDSERGSSPDLMSAEITNKDVKPKELVKGATGYEISADGKALLVRKRDSLFIIDSGANAPASLDDKGVDLSGWTFSIIPRVEWRQMFVEAWRLERDYFYARNMVHVDWKAMRDRYMPMVDRVSTRAELSDLISQMVAELSTLHTFVYGGDMREGDDDIKPASLGAVLERDQNAGGFRVEHIFRFDPDQPELCPPLAKPGVEVKENEIITQINGQSMLDESDLSVLLRNQAGKQVLLSVKTPAQGDEPEKTRQVIAVPISADAESDLRYHEWEYTRRVEVEEDGEGDIGYVHLRAMGSDNMAEFARGYYPVFNRKGLIIDVRHNRGGNIDSWILSRLMRKAWFFWQPRVGDPTWNMQYAFRGHMVVLCDERTASDGEAFSEGFKRLKLGKVIGTRTWGGEVWLSSSNFLVDRGIATAAEFGVFGPEGQWLIEGHGVEPDIVVDNLPHATFNGKDAQLEAAIEYLKQKIKDEPIPEPKAPPYVDNSFSP